MVNKIDNKELKIIKTENLDKVTNLENIENEVVARIDEIRDRGCIIGEGSTAKVFVCESDPWVCYKIIMDNDVFRISTEQEMKLQEASLRLGVRVPKPLFSVRGHGVEALAMQRIDGPSFEDILERADEIPPNFQSESAFLELEHFIKILHSNGIYHRDLAEKNLMMDGEGHPYIIDFGKSVRAFDEKEAYASRIVNPATKRYEMMHFTYDNVNLSVVRRKFRRHERQKKKAIDK
jgi:tRNA A-37 threonylcarbamoyl transferase component Bud32